MVQQNLWRISKAEVCIGIFGSEELDPQSVHPDYDHYCYEYWPGIRNLQLINCQMEVSRKMTAATMGVLASYFYCLTGGVRKHVAS